jgi:type I restriction enzyme S subunit
MEQNGRWIGGKYAFVKAEKAASDLRTNIARAGDIIVTQRGTMGQVSIVPDDSFDKEFVISQSQMAISVDPKCAVRDFVYYYLRSPDFAEYLSHSIIQAGVPHINLSILRQAPADWPNLGVQKAIASVLGALDDKIELNQRVNETQEAVARAIFKDWFIDFGPTRAKMEGRPPYLAPDIWALFPDRLDEDGKPEGWVAGKLLDLCELKRGYDLPTSQRRNGGFPIVSSSGISGRHDEKMATCPGVVTGRYGTIGQVFFIDEDFWPLNTALYVCDFKGHDPRFVYYVISNIDFTIYSDKGAVPGINRNHLHENPTICPSIALQTAFARTTQPFFEQQRLNRAESETLAATRDLLLPKLMLGEIRVRNVEKAVEAAK